MVRDMVDQMSDQKRERRRKDGENEILKMKEKR